MNPYSRLGLDPSATPGQVAAAYRRLAKETHPDVNPNDPTAARRFAEVHEAYRIISGGQAPGMTATRRDLSIEFQIDLEMAYGGYIARIPGSSGECEACDGTGFVRTAMRVACETCAGLGELRKDKGFLNIRISCQDCGGTGHSTRRKCARCAGCGTSTTIPATIRIPPGTHDGTAFLVEGGANDHAGGFYGDLEVIVRIRPHESYRVNGNDLETTVSIPVWTAALGGTAMIPGLSGGGFRLNIPPGSQSGRKFKLKGKGMPLSDGDLIVTVAVSIPDASEGANKAAFEALRAALGTRSGE